MLRIKKSWFRLKDTIRSVVDLIMLQSKLRGLELHVDFHEETELPGMIYNDENRLKQVLMNLLANALKFTRQGSIRVSVRRSSAHHVELSVSDTGTSYSVTSRKVFKA